MGRRKSDVWGRGMLPSDESAVNTTAMRTEMIDLYRPFVVVGTHSKGMVPLACVSERTIQVNPSPNPRRRHVPRREICADAGDRQTKYIVEKEWGRRRYLLDVLLLEEKEGRM